MDNITAEENSQRFAEAWQDFQDIIEGYIIPAIIKLFEVIKAVIQQILAWVKEVLNSYNYFTVYIKLRRWRCPSWLARLLAGHWHHWPMRLLL